MSTRPLRWSPSRRLVVLGCTTLLAVSLAASRSPNHAWAVEDSAGPLVFAGCGSNGPITRLLVQAFAAAHPEVRIDVRAVGSTNGIWLAAADAIPVGLMSRPLSESERGLGLTVMPYARTALVIAAHPAVADDNITVDELVGVYRGTRPRWRSGQRIVLLTREPGDSSIQLLSREIPGFRTAYLEGQRKGRAKLAYTEQQMIEALASRPHALGFSDLGTLTTEALPVHALKLNGIPATIETLASGQYPLVKTLAFVYRPDKVPAKVGEFLDFVRSAGGERILRAHGYLPAE